MHYHSAQAFTAPVVVALARPRTWKASGSVPLLWMNNNNLEDGSTNPVRPLTVSKKRVRRKSQVSEETTLATRTEQPTDRPAAATIPDPKTRRDDSVVTVPIYDVRDLVGGGTTTTTTTTPTATSIKSAAATTRQQDTNPLSVAAATSRSDSRRNDDNDDDDPLARLLIDAKEMQEQANNKNSRDNSNSKIDNSSNARNSVVATLQQVLSTIVTVDFFLVLALLAWFLAGIFCSAVLKDDAVQIAFNNNFERLTQPALGVLMIAALSDAVLKRDDEENP